MNQFVETQFVSVPECQSVIIIIHLEIFVKLLQAAPTRWLRSVLLRQQTLLIRKSDMKCWKDCGADHNRTIVHNCVWDLQWSQNGWTTWSTSHCKSTGWVQTTSYILQKALLAQYTDL